MNPSLLLSIVISSLAFCRTITICSADGGNLQDACPTAIARQQAVFINGFPCKNPANIVASDFKTSKLNRAGDTENFLRSATTIATAEDFVGLNTLGLSVARTDLALDGMVLLHAHPRASEMMFVSKGAVIAGFVDTKNHLFQQRLRTGDVFVFPRGLLHFILNSGFESATVFSVLNSQNPGVIQFGDALFQPHRESDAIAELMISRLLSTSALLANSTERGGF